MKEMLTDEAVKSHLLFILWRAKDPVRIGDLKGRMLGYDVSMEEILKSLWDINRIIYKEDNQVDLSVEGRHYLEHMRTVENKDMQPLLFEGKFNLAVLCCLCHRTHLVHQEDWPEVFKKQGNLHYALHQLKQYVDRPYSHWCQINATGRAFYEHHTKKLNRSQESGSSVHINLQANYSDPSVFSAADIKEMNEKLDRMNGLFSVELNKVKLGQELTYTDLMQEFEELRKYYHLTKKTWRQLFIGKLGEMVVAGAVSETVSKEILDIINPEVEKLLA